MDEERVKAIEILDTIEDYLYENKDKLLEEEVSDDKVIINGRGYYDLEDKVVEIISKD